MTDLSSGRRGFTIIELLVVAAILAVLAAIALPAAMMAREAARRTACANHFHQVGLAVDGYAAAFGCYPPSAVTPWTVAVAPYLEHRQYFDSYDHRFDPFSDSANASLGTQAIPELTCPSDSLVLIAPFDWVSSNVAGNIELFRPGRGPQSCVDGVAGTGLCTEVSTAKGLSQIEGPALFLGVEHSVHPGSFQMLFAGGSVRPLSIEIAPEIMRAIGTPAGGEVLSADF